MEREFKLYYDDLTEVAQHYLCVHFNTTSEEENWDSIPLAVIKREQEEEEYSNGTE